MLSQSPFFKIILPLLILLVLQACQGDTFLRSEKKILRQLEHKWNLTHLKSNQQREEWTFSDGMIYKNNFNSGDTLILSDTGKYALDLGFSKDRLIVTGFSGGNVFFNTTWQFIELTDEYLVIANNRENTSGLTLKEFVRLD